MKNEEKSKSQLIAELDALQAEVAGLRKTQKPESLPTETKHPDGKEPAQRFSEHRANALLEAIPDIMFRLNSEGVFLDYKAEPCDLYTQQEGTLVGKNNRDISPPAFADLVERKITETLSSGQMQTFEYQLPILGRGPVDYEARMVPSGADEVIAIVRDITRRKETEAALLARTRELSLLNNAGRAFVSSLNLDQVLMTVLNEVRHIIGILACSIWLVDQNSGEIICREVASPRDNLVRGWRLEPGQGLVGWVVQHGQSLNIPDVKSEKRHFKGVDQQTGLQLRSILTVPLQTKSSAFGVLQLLDETVNRFSPGDIRLAESLAALATSAIENARLYKQTEQDAKTKALLLQEVNHRVKNNLATITGLLHIERRHARQTSAQRDYEAIIDDLINRIKGLSRVHDLLSAANWSPLPLSEITRQVINSAVQALPGDRYILAKIIEPTPPLVITAKESHNLALIINELATNVVKYAATTQKTTHITVNIARGPDKKTVQFEFRDDGPGFPPAILQAEGRNVGLYIIENTVQHSLDGTVTFHNDGGAVVTIYFTKEVV